MSYPILYSATEISFDHNGFGILSDCSVCEVTEEANGLFELYMEYPMDGIHFEEIATRSIVKCKPDQFRDPQLFRVYSIKKKFSGIAAISAEHISYDLSGVPVKPFVANNVTEAMVGLKSNSVVENNFDFWTDKTTEGSFAVQVPSSVRSRLGGVEGSIIDVYGGEYEFDNFTIKLHNSRGENRGVSIRYGKNLTSMEQEQNCASVATGIYPYWAGDVDGSTVVVELPEKVVEAPGAYNFIKIRPVDMTNDFEEKPTVEQLRSASERYVKNNEIGVPSVSMSVSFVQLQQSEEYKHLKLLERVSLFDTVSVEFPAFGVSAAAKAVKVVYNAIAERVESVDLGSVRASISDTIAEQQTQIVNKPTKTDLQRATAAATSWLTNGKGYKVERRDPFGNTIDTLYMDAPNIDEAVNVLRIGQSGIGFSNNGVNGPYKSAWTIDGGFNADFITTGKLSANLIKTGVIQSNNGLTTFNLDSGSLSTEGSNGNFYTRTELNNGEVSFWTESGERIASIFGYGDEEPEFTLVANNIAFTTTGLLDGEEKEGTRARLYLRRVRIDDDHYYYVLASGDYYRPGYN
jgi:phage minor structural protein